MCFSNWRIPLQRQHVCLILSFGALFNIVSLAKASRPDTSPRPGFLLTKSQAILVQNAWNSFGLFKIKDGMLRHEFQVDGWVQGAYVSADEELALIHWGAGNVELWKTKTGQKLWQKKLNLGTILDVSMAEDKKSFVAGGTIGRVGVFDIENGAPLATFEAPDTSIMSAALRADGSKGVFITQAGDLLEFHTGRPAAAKKVADQVTSMVRFSSNDKYIVCSADSALSVFVTGDKWTRKDIGEFEQIRNIKPLHDGSFVVIGATAKRLERAMRYWPNKSKLEGISKNVGTNVVDVDPDAMLALENSWMLKSRLIDLNTGKVLLSLDNSSRRAPARLGMQWILGGGAVLLVLFFFGAFCEVRAKQ